MSDEPVLDAGSRNAILAQLAGKRAPAPIAESRTPGVEVSPTIDLSTAAKKFDVEAKTTKVTETKAEGATLCKHCSHKIWNDGSEWQHSGKPHNDNCDCRDAEPGGVAEGRKKTFDSTTPFDQLLEACADSHIAVKEAEEADAVVADETRQLIIEKINQPHDLSILKNWRF